ncbi:hypothetical protein SAY86_016217 [Trapa natans]|uniref:Homeobox-leucine zipper protein n=1 Tax=Trapa natans TaxID=22666 RepID=A0AAN7LBW4_TRANT|nr:hypothetical protein SAY86_016217 [Trapa natans]
MADDSRVFAGAGGSTLVSLLQNQRFLHSSSSDTFFLSGASPPFMGTSAIVSFEDIHRGSDPTNSFFRPFDPDENGEDDADEFFSQPEKKRRLTANQVQSLEKSFELENKLDPERKLQLSKDLGLQPRQVAIWFQNRRARWKTKQLEKDYDTLQADYNALKAEFDSLLKERDELKSEVLLLKDKLLHTEGQGGEKPKLPAEGEAPIPAGKREMFDSASESPHFTEQSSLLEPADSSYAFEPDQSDLSQDEEDISGSKRFLNVFPKPEMGEYSGNLPAFWSWSY